MRKIVVLLISIIAGTLAAHADDYPYLTFETADGVKTSVRATSLTINIKDGILTAGAQEFTLADLSKMYFTTSDETTTGIEEISTVILDDTADIYDLQGRKVSKEQMRHGVYVIKTGKGTCKMSVK